MLIPDSWICHSQLTVDQHLNLGPGFSRSDAHIRLFSYTLTSCNFTITHLSIPAIVYLATFISVQTTGTRSDTRSLTMFFTIVLKKNPKPCITISRLILVEGRRRHYLQKRPAFRISVKILSRFHRLEGVLRGRNFLDTKEVFVLFGEVIQFLLMKEIKRKSHDIIITR